VGRGVREGARVVVGGAVRDGARVQVGRGVFVIVALGLGMLVAVSAIVADGARVAVDVGGSPSTTKRPTDFHSMPTKICTSYSPGSHSWGAAIRSAYP